MKVYVSQPHTSFLRVWRILLVLSVVKFAAMGQVARPTGQINGTVRDVMDSSELPGARLTLSGKKGDLKPRSALTNASGTYVIRDVPYGEYVLTTRLEGFEISEVASVTVDSLGRVIDFVLTPIRRAEVATASQSNTRSGEDHRPTFAPAGIRGTTAPSGYSAAASDEETSRVMEGVGGLDGETLVKFMSRETVTDCNHQVDLLTKVRGNPTSFGPNHALGIFYSRHGDFIQSIRYLRLAYESNPADSQNSGDLAIAYTGARQYSDAIDLLQRAIERSSNDAALVRLLAIAYKDSGNAQRSTEEYIRAVNLDRGEENLFECGIGMLGLGSVDVAAKLFTSATHAHPDSARLWMGLGIAQELQHRETNAIRSLIRAIDVDRDYFPSYSFLADLSGVSSETDYQIKSRLAQFVVARPEDPLAHYYYALALWRRQRVHPEAVSSSEIESQLKLAIAKDPRMAQAHFKLGVIYAGLGDYAQSADELQATVRFDPGNAQAHYRLSQAYRHTNRPDLASLELEKFKAMRVNSAGDEDDSGLNIHILASRLNRDRIQGSPCRVSEALH